jgi:hypothetical protein
MSENRNETVKTSASTAIRQLPLASAEARRAAAVEAAYILEARTR